jgi:hypothetical protein
MAWAMAKMPCQSTTPTSSRLPERLGPDVHHHAITQPVPVDRERPGMQRIRLADAVAFGAFEYERFVMLHHKLPCRL